jgi:spermidine synthase
VKPALNDWLVRAYCLSALHANPEEVLMIGLSGGSWGQIVAANPHVKRLTIVEINHSYNQVIAAHECVRSLLKNPKVEIIIDDGRRWLERNPDRKFDAILMNTAIAEAHDAARMATAMNLAVQAGRLAYLSGRMPKRLYASASSPIEGAIK